MFNRLPATLLAVLALCLLGAVGCRTVTPPSRSIGRLPAVPPSERGFRPGESARYSVHVGGAPVATCSFRLENAEWEGKPCTAVRYEVASAGAAHMLSRFRFTGSALLHPTTLMPLRAEKNSDKPKKRKGVAVVFDHEAGRAHVTKTYSYRETRTKEVSLSDGEVELLSMLIMIRAANIAPDKPQRTLMLYGDDHYEAVFSKKGVEERKTPAGKFPTVMLAATVRRLGDNPQEPPEPWRVLRIWLTTDTGLPVRIEIALPFGTAAAELLSHTPGAEAWPERD
jgi:uncharacterized protein DUF3108